MKKLLTLTALLIASTLPAHAKEKRCGWFENPTPGNAWLIDRDGEWVVGYQGGHQAKGDWPDFTASQWVKTNINYGYGCACMTITANTKKYITQIHSAYAQDLLVCKNDKYLKNRD